MKKALMLILVCIITITCNGLAEESFSSNPDAIEQTAQSVLMLEVFDSNDELIATGSGFVAYNNHTIVTNYHVIEGADWILANSDAGYQYMVTKVLVADRTKDIAICSFMSPTDLTPLTLNTDGELKRAESIVAIGSPIGITNTVSLGNISALYEADSVNWIQFTAPISSGSSGGALFDNSGSVIGVTSASYIDTQNLNLAVHISEVDKLYKGWNGIASSFEEYFLIANATPAPKPTPTPSPTPIPTTVPKPTPTPKIYKVLWLDDTGEEVKRLQQALIDLGYLSGKADGIFGKMTGEAVRLFNAQHGLSSDEFWGTLASSQTQQILFDGSPQKYEDLP